MPPTRRRHVPEHAAAVQQPAGAAIDVLLPGGGNQRAAGRDKVPKGTLRSAAAVCWPAVLRQCVPLGSACPCIALHVLDVACGAIEGQERWTTGRPAGAVDACLPFSRVAFLRSSGTPVSSSSCCSPAARPSCSTSASSGCRMLGGSGQGRGCGHLGMQVARMRTVDGPAVQPIELVKGRLLHVSRQ